MSMGNLNERVAAIRAVRTQHELDDVMDKYREQLLAETPELRAHYAFSTALLQRRYFQARSLVPLNGYKGRQYREVIRVIGLAADKQFSMAQGRAA